MAKGFGTIHSAILKAFKKHGINQRLTVPQLRAELGLKDNEQREFVRRVREVRAFGYDLKWDRQSYWLTSFTPKPVADTDPISGSLYGEVLDAAHGRCGMCGKTIAEDGIKLVVDHRVPRNWGGKPVRDNLWGICQTCNIQKKDFFASFSDDVMRQFMQFDEPIMRIGELLKTFKGKLVPRRLLEFAGEGQDEWPRRLRELRELGWTIKQVHDPSEKGKYAKTYLLVECKPWPPDLHSTLREHRRKVTERIRSKD